MNSRTPVVSVPEDENVTCPICTKVCIERDVPWEGPNCPHLAFLFISGETFEYAEPGLETWLDTEEAKADDEGKSFDKWECLQSYLPAGSTILEQIEHGMGCGPITFKVWAGFQPKLEVI